MGVAMAASHDIARVLEAVPGAPKVVEMCNRVLVGAAPPEPR